jgi:virginiamycin A acetyltransferase
MSVLSKLRNRILNRVVYLLERHNRINLKPGSSIHATVKMQGVRIDGSVEIGEACRILGGVRLYGESKISVGRYTSINGPNTDIISRINTVNIGSFCSIARNVSIQEFNHRYDGLTTYYIHRHVFRENPTKGIYSNGAIEIGNDVWIGTQCVIMSGAKIGNGAVVGANSVVVGEIPPYAIVAGSPAKVLKFRFSESRIIEIESMKWWEWSEERLRQMRHLFDNDERQAT